MNEFMTLSEIAHGRSGDKGNHANIAIIAHTQAGYDWLCQHLTAEVVAGYFAPMQPARVVRYEAPNVWGLNFMLHDILAGGASRSLRIDTQGKTLALTLLQMRLEKPAKFDQMTRASAVHLGSQVSNGCQAAGSCLK
jgi:hypothetical protein